MQREKNSSPFAFFPFLQITRRKSSFNVRGRKEDCMSKQTVESNGQYPPEFREWLKGNKVPKKLRKDPEILRQQYQEWRKSIRKDTPRKRSLFGIPKINLDFGTIVNQVKTMSELLETLNSAREIIRSPRNDKDGLL
jgi:hypothetical protein